MMTVREALTRATDQLAANPHLRPTALADAAMLLMHLLGTDRAGLIAHPERPLDREQLAGYQRLVERRLRFEPMQYIVGTQEFFGLTLAVSPAVLIPRPETELLVEAVVERAGTGPVRILDVGTGSGAIAIALAHTLPEAEVTAVDLSAEELAVARANAVAHGLEGRIRFVESDLLAGLPAGAGFDVVVSNPPYVAEGDAAELHPQVRDHEPARALFAGSDGLAIYERLIPEVAGHLVAGGLLALEIGYGQRGALAALLEGWRGVEFLEDLQGIPRVALARRS